MNLKFQGPDLVILPWVSRMDIVKTLETYTPKRLKDKILPQFFKIKPGLYEYSKKGSTDMQHLFWHSSISKPDPLDLYKKQIYLYSLSGIYYLGDAVYSFDPDHIENPDYTEEINDLLFVPQTSVSDGAKGFLYSIDKSPIFYYLSEISTDIIVAFGLL